MNHLSVLFVAAAVFVSDSFATSPADQATLDLIARVVPGKEDHFLVDTTMPKIDGKDVFSVSDAANGKIQLRGNNGVSVASAFNWYLKNRAQCHLSWCGDQLTLPATLPKVGDTTTVVCPLQYRVNFNYCTLSYSAAWWDWKRWEREIDFMAMNGINTPLSMVGLEGVWYNTLRKHGFTDQETRQFLVGPGFFAWQWMTNIENHCGPLPKSWIDQNVVLGRKILDRERALGMQPIQQGFTGHVPRLAKQKFPKAKIELKQHWVHFPGAAQLDPLDPLFQKIGRTFLEEQKKLLGSSHFYGCDPFHEGHPPDESPAYLAKVGKTINDLIKSSDSKGKIIMQSWSIREHIVKTIPKENILVVDLAGWKKDFWGYDFVTGRLHNFGGRTKLHGDLRNLANNQFAQMTKTNPACKGGGLFMEGIIQNPVYYDLAFDSFWRSEKVNITSWLHDYARRRYGAPSISANKAWDLLLETAYKPGTDGVEASSMVAARPAIRPTKSGPNTGFSIPFPQERLLEAWTNLLSDGDQLKTSDAYLYDIVDVGREVLDNHAQTLQPKIRRAWEKKDLAAFDKACGEFNQLLLDIDELVGTRPEFLLSKWIDDARSFGITEEDKNLYEKNARTLVSVWGPYDESTGEMKIYDYSWREWNGLIKDFYLVRWQKHQAMLRKHLVDGTPYSEQGLPDTFGRLSFRANDFFKALAQWEIDWASKPGGYGDPKPKGDALALARRFHDKYASAIKDRYSLDPSEAAGLGKAIGKWSPDSVNRTLKTITLPVTEVIDGEGTYEIHFRYIGGTSRLNILSVELIENQKSLAKDAHKGHAGNEHYENIYKVKLPSHAFGTDYSIRFTAQTEGTDDSNGQIFMNKME